MTKIRQEDSSEEDSFDYLPDNVAVDAPKTSKESPRSCQSILEQTGSFECKLVIVDEAHKRPIKTLNRFSAVARSIKLRNNKRSVTDQERISKDRISKDKKEYVVELG